MTLHEHATQEAFLEHEGEMQGAFSKLEEEAQEALLELKEETQERFSEHEQEQQQKEGEAGPASGSANLEGPALSALRKLTNDGNIPPILSSRTRSRRPHTGVEGASLHCFLPAIEAGEENGVKDALACDGGGHGYARDAGYTGTEESAAGDGIAGMGQMAEDRGDRDTWNGRELRL